MNDKKHTPGPWRWSPLDDDGPLIGRNGKIVLQPGYTSYIGDIYGDIFGTIKASAADKKLIAAAPESLGALKDVLAVIAEAEEAALKAGEKPAFHLPIPLVNRIAHIVRKAEGGTP